MPKTRVIITPEAATSHAIFLFNRAEQARATAEKRDGELNEWLAKFADVIDVDKYMTVTEASRKDK